MRKFYFTISIFIALMMTNCNPNTEVETAETTFQWEIDRFADIRILRYQIPDFDKLNLQQKKLVYFLTQAGLAGRDIIYDQNHRLNLTIRKKLEEIYENYPGDRDTREWIAFETYVKRVWFSNGIHHHYSHNKFIPECPKEYFKQIADDAAVVLDAALLDFICNPDIDGKKVSKAQDVDLLQSSAVNFYGIDITEAEAIGFYRKMADTNDPRPVSYGLNSQLVKTKDGLKEHIWKAGGMYGAAIENVVHWLEKAVEVAENDAQADALRLLIKYYQTGDLRTWDEYNIAWVNASEGDIDYINGFIEVYNDPLGYKANYETIVQIKDFEASERMEVVANNIQWFEDNSPIHDEYKKPNVVGVSYKVVNVAGEAGDASPATPIGVNLPNADWIRVEHGSKSVSLGNIEGAYNKASIKGILEEFTFDIHEKERSEAHGEVASKLHTALHEVVGHASGRLKEGVSNAKETLKNYYSTLEEARADLVALYYIMDPKLVELGLMETLDVGKAEYDGYIRNGLMVQLRRIELGENVEEDHMRNRQLVALWVYEKGKADNVIEKKVLNGKTYFVVRDYDKLRILFGELLREVQRIKSEGDFEAGKALVESYGVKVDRELHKEVLRRAEKLNIPPYAGFVNPELNPVKNNGEITDIVVEYPKDFAKQMLFYSKQYGVL
jgi:dipeptidyl-peptidase III